MSADWPTSNPPQLQAQGPADNPTIIYGQTNAQVDTTGMVQFQDLQLRGPEGLYNICFAAVSSLVSLVPLVGQSCTHLTSSFALARWYINSMSTQKAANDSTRLNADDVTSMQHVFFHVTMTDHVHLQCTPGPAAF